MDARTLPPIVGISEADPHDIAALLDTVFGPNRRARTAYRIRDGMAQLPDLSFAMLDEDRRLIGSLQCWPVALDGIVPLVLVGPVAIAPAHQRDGLGRAMMNRMIDRAEAIGADPLVLIGDPEYYDRFFGFSARWTARWSVPGPVERRRLLARVPEGVILPAEGALGPRR